MEFEDIYKYPLNDSHRGTSTITKASTKKKHFEVPSSIGLSPLNMNTSSEDFDYRITQVI